MHTVCAMYWLSDAVACSALQCMGRVRDYVRQYARCERHLLGSGDTNNRPGVRGTPQIHPLGYSTRHLFQNYLNIGYRFYITFIFVRCRSSLAVITPAIFFDMIKRIWQICLQRGKNKKQESIVSYASTTHLMKLWTMCNYKNISL